MVAEEFGPLGVEFDGFSNPRLHKDRWELNKSPFIYGRHMTSYETRTYKKVIMSEILINILFKIFYLGGASPLFDRNYTRTYS